MKYLITLVQRHEDFRLAEFDALLRLRGLDPAATYLRAAYRADLPYLVCEFATEADAVAVCSRGILIKSAMELWADAGSYEALVEVN